MRDLTSIPAEAGPGPARLLDYIRVDAPQPVVLAYGIGVDSTALLLELESRGTLPDLVITGDPGVEKPETYAYQKMIAAWMAARGIPYVTVRYTPRRFKHWPPYFDLLSNVLTNATLPSISLGRHPIGSGRPIRIHPHSLHGANQGTGPVFPRERTFT
jgi:hypothetical protein